MDQDAPYPGVLQYQSDLASIYRNVGNLYYDSRQWTDAKNVYQQARSLLDTLVRANPAVTDYQTDLALLDNNLGTVLLESDQFAEALVCYQRAGDVQRKLVSLDPHIPRWQKELALTCSNSRLCLRNCQPREAATR